MINEYASTIFLYIGIICVSSLFAKRAYRFDGKGFVENRAFFIISLGILLLFLGFADVGTDYENYRIIFLKSTDISYWASTRIEKGYLFFNLIVRIFTSDFRVFHFVWAFVMLGLVFSTIWKYRFLINPGWAVLSYTTIFMFQSLDLMRMYLAIAVAFWGVRFYIEKKYYWYIGVIFAAFLIHKSALCLIVPYVIWMFTRNKGRYFLKIAITSMLLVGLYFMRSYIFDGNFLGYGYLARATGTLGMIWVIYHMPIAILLVPQLIKREKDDLLEMLFVYFCISIIFWILSYFVDAIGRATYYFTYPFIILPQYLMLKSERNIALKEQDAFCVRKKWTLTVNRVITRKTFWKLLFIIYYFFRAYMMLGYLVADGIESYSNIIF